MDPSGYSKNTLACHPEYRGREYTITHNYVNTTYKAVIDKTRKICTSDLFRSTADHNFTP